MELLDNLALGFATATTLWNLLFCLIGVLLGTLIGVLPGIGATATIAMLLPITFQIGDPVSSLIMLAGIYYGAQYGGSTTAILINMPGESSSAVTAIDGYQMARNGRAGAALAIAAIGSFFAGTVSTFLVALFAPPLTAIALKFGVGRVFLADDRRPGLVGRAGAWLDRQGAGDGRARPAARPRRHRHLHGRAALYARHPRICRRAEFRRRRGRRVRRRRDPAQSRERARARGDDQEGQRAAADPRRLSGDGGARSCAAPSSARRSASCPAAARSWRPSPPTLSKSASRKTPRNSARARSPASPDRNRPTMPAPRPPSSRC